MEQEMETDMSAQLQFIEDALTLIGRDCSITFIKVNDGIKVSASVFCPKTGKNYYCYEILGTEPRLFGDYPEVTLMKFAEECKYNFDKRMGS